MEKALIEEYDQRGRWGAIARFDFCGDHHPSANWWQVSDIHKIAMGMPDVPFRDYREFKRVAYRIDGK